MRIIRYAYPHTRSLIPAFGFAARSPWTAFEGEIDRRFDSAGSPPFPVEVDEDKDNAYVRAELPGVQRGDITVEIADGVLTVAATRKQKNGEKTESVSLTRSVGLPENVDPEKAGAACENGVLTVTLPKREETKPKKISVAVS